MQWPRPLADRVAAVSTLDDPVRRALLELVTGSDRPVSRDEAAEVLGLSRRAAAFHLDRLAEKGLLAAAVEESTRTGEPAREALMRLAGDLGRNLGARAGTFENLLRDHGFQPHVDGEGAI